MIAVSACIGTRGLGVLTSVCDVLEMSVVIGGEVECVTFVCVLLGVGWEVLRMSG